jgi:hypothetical protein
LFDLTIFPIALDAGREHYELPGLFYAAAPRKAARMRTHDQLILYWKVVKTTGGSGGFTPTQQQEILTRLSETYFSTPGSVTAGLRAVIIRLNDFLLRRNLRAAQEGQLVGVMTLAAIHGDFVFIANAGSAQAFVLGKNQVHHFNNDPAHGGGRGLGLSRVPTPRFHQSAISPGDVLLISPDAPQGWTEKSLAGSPQLSFDHLRRRLLSDAGVELQAAVIKLQPGKGQVTYWRPAERVLAGPQHSTPVQPAETLTPPAESFALEPPTIEDAAVAFDAQPVTDQPQAEAALVDEVVEAAEPVEQSEPASIPEETSAPVSFDGSVVSLESDPAETDSASVVPQVEAPQDEQEEHAWENELFENESFDQGADEAGLAGSTEEQQAVVEPSGQPVYLGRLVEAEEDAEAASMPLQPRPAVDGEFSTTGRAVPPEAGKWKSAPRISRMQSTGASVPAESKPAARAQKTVVVKPAGPSAGEQLRRSLAALWRKGSAARARSGQAFSSVSARLFPHRTEPLINLSPAWMLIIAMIIPLVVTTVATTVYFEAGRSEQFEILFNQAQQYALQAGQVEDPLQKKAGWERVYEYVTRAEAYGSSPESAALRTQALAVVDEMDGIVRLGYQPAISGGFPAGVNITRMVSNLNEVYLLDSSEGRILRLMRTTSSNYDPDANFNCGPAKAGGAFVGPLVDIAPLPINNEMRATIMGIDSEGNLVYCSTGKVGFDSSRLITPDTGWNNIVAMTTYGDTLYVLDPGSNAVYRYDGRDGIFADPPHLYFDEDIPFMSDVVDLAVDQEFLYLLHRNGRMTVCSSGGFTFAQTRCTDPAPYGDSRAGYEPSPLTFDGSTFIHIQTTQPPDPSLFAFDSENKSIYHLSLRKLNLQRQYRPQLNTDFPVPNSAPTAFNITPNRRALLAFGNLIFFAPLP